MELTQARLKELLKYDRETGIFTWRVNRPPVHIGQEAGCYGRGGRCAIVVDRKRYFRSRLAWLYVTGKWPEAEVDHRNHDESDDRWSNLRRATRAENNANRRTFSNNRARQKGVHFRADVGKYRAMISCGGRNRCLGYFDNKDDAARIYLAAARAQFGAFAIAA